MTASFTRTALVLLATSAVAACTTYPAAGEGSMRPNYPTRLPPGAQAPATTPAAQTPPAPSEAPAVITVPPPAVTSRPLPPISSQPAPPPPSRPAEQTVTRQTATGRVVEAQGPAASYTVQRGDNLDAIARKLGTTRQQLADDNDLSPPYSLRAGQVLKGPASQGRAYVVASGDTLSGIGRRFSVTAQQIAEANEMSVGAPLSVGQRLMLPEGISDRGAQTVTTRVPVTSNAAPTAEVAAPPVREPEPAPATQTVTTTKTSVTGRVSDLTVPGETYTVKSGDNLESIAKKLDTTVKQLADDNDLKKPYRLQPGDKLKGPSTTTKAYTTVAGDTLELVARRFNVTARALAQANDMGTRDRLRAGRKLRLPEGYRDRGPVRETVRTVVAAPTPPAPTPAAPPPRQEPVRPAPVQPAPVQPAPTQPAPTPPRQTPPPVTNYPRPTTPTPPPSSYPRPTTPTTPSTPPIVPSAGPIPNDQISTLGRGRFQWPLRGDVMSEFGPKGVNQRNDGINIRTSTGTPVRSAADGDVVYAGDQVPGFGNLVLIKHADGWVTAYGHLSRVEVKMQQKVSQGQQIGQAGSSGGVSEPQLHFEVRYAPTPQDRARPIDPLLVLPR